VLFEAFFVHFKNSRERRKVLATTQQQIIQRRAVGGNVWLSRGTEPETDLLSLLEPRPLQYEVLASEKAVGQAMLEEIESAASSKEGSLVVIILGGRGAQALHRQLGTLAKTSEKDWLLQRLHIFTQDALAPLRMYNGLSFVRDFERLLGDDFFRKVLSFNSIKTDAVDLEAELARYVEKLESIGGIDLLFLGLGPEAGGASHLAYIKPGSGATVNDIAGIIPISASILEHHITKFKAGGTLIVEADELECRAAKHILTLGPAAIVGARRIVQSIVDASTAPAKRESYRRLLDTEISSDSGKRATQLDENPGLWLRLHPNVRSLILADVLEN
jgi:6-phosphogluconolactonase/glucosamine-6-phosphate isomerase/deaminase